MKNKTAACICLIFFLFIFSCSRAVEEEVPVDFSQIKAEIEKANLKFGEIFRQGDASAVAALYSEDATLLPPNSDVIKGSAGIEAFWGGAMAMGATSVVLTTGEVFGMGDLVCEIGQYRLTIQPEGMEEMEDVGKYIVIWKKDDNGSWRLHIDIWNSSLPAQ